jgi:glycosyltransferase involved in cell wall biosynthesis
MKQQKRRIKLLLTIPNFDTAGTAEHMFEIAKALNKDLYEVHLMCEHDRGELYQEVHQSGLPVHVFDFKTAMSSKVSGLLNIAQKAIQFRKFKFDLIHSWNYSADYSEALLAKFVGCKWMYIKKNMSWGGTSANSWAMRTRLAANIVVINSKMQELFFNGKKNISYIPHGIDTRRFNPENNHTKGDLKQELGLPVDSKVVLSVANAVPLKKIEFLVQNFEQLVLEKPNAFLLLVGDYSTSYGRDIKKLVDHSPAKEHIKIVGHRRDVERFYQISDLFVMCSEREGFPLTMLEAMSNGAIPIGNDIDAIKDQLKAFPDLIFPSGDSGTCLAKMKYYISLNGDTRKQLKKDLRSTILEKYNFEREVKDYEELYQKVYYGDFSS